MSTLLIDEIETSLRQKVTVGSSNEFVYAIRPGLYKQGSPAGGLVLKIYESDGTTLRATSDTLTTSTIETNLATANNFHGALRFIFSSGVGLEANTSYYIHIEGTGGYSYTSSVFYAWKRDWDDTGVDALRKNAIGYTPNDDYDAPYEYEVWSYKDVIR